MKKLSLAFSLMGLALVLAICPALFAQTILTNTTLSAAQSVSQNYLSITSATGITASPGPDPTKTTWLYVDRELEFVTAVNGTTISVIRGYGSTEGHSHNSGSVVFVVPASVNFGAGSAFTGPSVPEGTCVRSNEVPLPRIQFATGIISDCLGGQWVNGDAHQTTRVTQKYIQAPVIGAVAITGAVGTSTATTAAELYCTEIDLSYSKLLTGLAAHIGATGGTDKWITALYDSSGTLLANSATAGATVSGTGYAWQAEAFTTPYYAVGPGQYFGCVQSNGTTATLDLITTGIDALTLTYKSASAGTFGTLPNFTAPTGFTTVNGAFLYAY
jgi:hypothetical protein